MTLILALPLAVRLALLSVLGAALGAAVNAAVYGWAMRPRDCSPWLVRRGAVGALTTARPWWARTPVVGWLAMRREASAYGRFFWLRPMLVEAAMAAAVPALYWWETVAFGLLPTRLPAGLAADTVARLHFAAHTQFFGHTILLAFMLAGSLLDVDERVIPDAITLPCTLIGLLLATLLPTSLLPEARWILEPAAGMVHRRLYVGFLTLASPSPWPQSLCGRPEWLGLLVALGCWAMWNFAILPRTWYTRHGLRRAMQLAAARAARERASYWIALTFAVGVCLTVGIWILGANHWTALVTSLVGVAVASGLIWVVRVIGSAALAREAMGFGDVLLMAMIGAFVGWQPAIFIFFLAPVAGLVVGLLQTVLSTDREIPYGPFLCLATAAVIVLWGPLWDWGQHVFDIPWFVPTLMTGCMALMCLLLMGWRFVASLIFRNR